jgi:hypothetical protein
MTPKISPKSVAYGYDYAIFDNDKSRITGRLYETYGMAHDLCKAMNAKSTTRPYVVVEIDHDADTCVSVDADGEIVDSPIGEYDATLEALRYVYEMLDADELPTHSILDRLRGFCEHAGLLEFA